jgi:hypothetical protein
MKYESLITDHSKDMANVKVFADRQTDRQMDRPKTICPDLSIQGHKNIVPLMLGYKRLPCSVSVYCAFQLLYVQFEAQT